MEVTKVVEVSRRPRKSERRSSYRRSAKKAFHQGGQTGKIKTEYPGQLNDILEKVSEER